MSVEPVELSPREGGCGKVLKVNLKGNKWQLNTLRARTLQSP